MSAHPPPKGHAAQPFLRLLLSTLSRVDVAEMVAYVVLSLASALVGNLSAVWLVPLVQPGRPLGIGGGMLDLHGGIEVQAVAFAGATAAFALLRWQASRLGARLVGRHGMCLRRMVHARLIDAPLGSLADATSAEIASILTHNVEIMVQGFSAVLQLLVAGVTVGISLAFACWVSPPLVLMMPVLGAFGLLASRMYGREQAQVSRHYVADLTRLFWHSEDFPRRLRHVRSFEREEAEKASYGAISERLGTGYRRQLELVASGRLVLELLAAVGIGAMFVLAHRWRGIDQASLIAVCLLLGRLLPYLTATRQSFQQLRSAAPAFDLWARYMDIEPVRAGASSPRPSPPVGPLHIERLTLQPPPIPLEVEDLVLAPGELTLICGDSGIGKSSLVDVLAGMTRPARFSARVDRRVLGFEEYGALVRNGAYISQNVRPWQQTVRECLLWAAPEATDEMLHRALADVGLEKRLAKSPHGLDTALNDSSSRFSGGELQRLLVAQVILRRPYLALLDEATSALDAASEIAILQALKRRLPQTIVIAVSHRASVAQIADQCLTIDNDLVATVSGRGDLRRASGDH
jgi:ATP-binding cassette subfamily C protein